jgi:hypothetical protein
MDEAFGESEVVRKPTVDTPWFELKYTSPSEFVNFVNRIDNVGRLREERQGFFFRGQASSAWALKPRIVRLLNGVPIEKALGYEFDAVGYFRERAHLCVPGLVPDKEAFPEWLCLMQHFSAPTRMLDWTTSFVVALYFAVSEEPLAESGAVWFFPQARLWHCMSEKYPDPELTRNSSAILRNRDSFIEFGRRRAMLRLDGYKSDRKSERIIAQRGVFTFCEQLFADHAMIIGSSLLDAAATNRDPFLCKVIITPEAKRFLRQYLSKMNVTAATLFPGTDGLGRATCETIRVERETDEDATS